MAFAVKPEAGFPHGVQVIDLLGRGFPIGCGDFRHVFGDVARCRVLCPKSLYVQLCTHRYALVVGGVDPVAGAGVDSAEERNPNEACGNVAEKDHVPVEQAACLDLGHGRIFDLVAQRAAKFRDCARKDGSTARVPFDGVVVVVGRWIERDADQAVAVFVDRDPDVALVNPGVVGTDRGVRRFAPGDGDVFFIPKCDGPFAWHWSVSFVGKGTGEEIMPDFVPDLAGMGAYDEGY